MQVITDGSDVKVILSLDYILQYISRSFSYKQVKSVTPYSFTVGSNNRGENLNQEYGLTSSLFFGHLFLSINPNDNDLADEKIEIKYRSYFNQKPYYKYITRFVEKENLINESTNSIELFDDLQITQQSNKYDFYFTFIGFKIDVS